MKDFFFRLLAVMIGLVIVASAAAGWHYWHVEGPIACIAGGGAFVDSLRKDAERRCQHAHQHLRRVAERIS